MLAIRSVGSGRTRRCDGGEGRQIVCDAIDRCYRQVSACSHNTGSGNTCVGHKEGEERKEKREEKRMARVDGRMLGFNKT